MGYIPPGAVEWIKLVKPAQWAGITVQNPSEWALRERFDIDRKQVDQIVKAALLDRQTSMCAVTRRRFSSGCKPRPATRSSRKQPGQAWR